MPETGRHIEKFAFIGAQSVGKTTMTNHFRDRFAGNSHVVVLEEEAKKFFESNHNIPDRSVRVQEQIQDRVLAQEQIAHNKPETKLIISDRSVIDPIVLTSIWDTPEDTRRLLQRVTGWLPTYTSFILLSPNGVPSEPDENRRETEAERLSIHDAFGEFCNTNGLPVVEVSGTLPERITTVENLIFKQFPDKKVLEGDSIAALQAEVIDEDRKEREKIAIIGGGFAGICVTSHLIGEAVSQGKQLGITLFDQNRADESVPYNTNLPSSFRLNHEATNMGVVNPFSKDAGSDDFYQWLQANRDTRFAFLNDTSIAERYKDFDLSDPNAYLPRSLYGFYLRARYEALLEKPDTDEYHFTHRKSRVTIITRDNDGFTVFDRDSSSRFSKVVLCTGDQFNYDDTRMFYASKPHEYLADKDVKRTDEIGLLGSSLSAIETAITLAERGYESITMFSRAGRLPKIRGNTSEYTPTHVNAQAIDDLRDATGMIDPYAIARLFKKELDHAYTESGTGLYQANGINWNEVINNSHPLQQLDADIQLAQAGKDQLWRSVISSTREFQSDLWDSLTTEDCREVLQRYSSLILSYFAPMPLPQAERLQSHLRTGRIKLRPQITRYDQTGDQWSIQIRDNHEVPVKHLIDARGYSQDASQNALIASLIEAGLVEKHPINGIRANKQSQVIKDGEVVDDLYAMGAVLYGERPLNASTPTITQYAKKIAAQVVQNL